MKQQMSDPKTAKRIVRGLSHRWQAVIAAGLLLTAAVSNASPVQAETTFPELKLLSEDWKPYHYVEDGVVKGQTADLLDKILEKVGSTQTREDIAFLPWARAFHQAQVDANTVLFSTGRTPERERLFKWAGPILKFDSYFIGKKERNFEIEKSEDLHQYKVGVVIDGASAVFAKRHGIPEENTTFNSQGIFNVKMLAADRIDFIPIQWKNFARLAAKAGIDPSEFEPVFLADTVSLNFAFNLKTADSVVDRFQTALEEVLGLQKQAKGEAPTREVN